MTIAAMSHSNARTARVERDVYILHDICLEVQFIGVVLLSTLLSMHRLQCCYALAVYFFY